VEWRYSYTHSWPRH